MKTILITDILFISPKAEQKLKHAGFAIERIEKSDATEAEMIKAIKGKSGYIIGGMEVVTDKIIEAGDKLECISFTGADWAHFIPGHETATKLGIPITNTPGSTKFAVAEFTITLILMMLRHALDLGGPGAKRFMTSQSLASSHVGIVGLGNIGSEVARMLKGLGCQKISYWNRTRNKELEKSLRINYVPLEKLFTECDVITNHLSSQTGELITAKLINSAPDDTLFINTGGTHNYNLDALYKRLAEGTARAAFDVHGLHDDRFKKLPFGAFYMTNTNAAFNTRQMLDLTDDMATTSIINVLKTGKDQFVANLPAKRS